MRTESFKDAIFVTPPDMARFRLHAQRAIVADWKTPPASGAALAQWLDRLRRLCGVEKVTGLASLNTGYGNMSPGRIGALTREYSADFVVLGADRCPPIVHSTFPIVFENDHFVVVSTSSDGFLRTAGKPKSFK